jgi:hypothetical protein
MAKSTRPLAGQSQRKYFRDLFRADPGVTPDAADRLTEACAAEIAQIRVRLPMAVRRSHKGTAKAAPAAKESEPAVATPAQPPAALAFDPHAFSLIVEMRRGGRDGLLSKLSAIGDIASLKAIAKAQHVSLEGELTDRTAVVSAILSGTERRIAHREAAAS